MNEPIRALLMILVLTLPMLWAGQRWMSPGLMAIADYRRRAAQWVAILVLAYVTHGFWLFAGAMALLLLKFAAREPRPFTLYLFLFFVIPTFPMEIPGFLGVNQIFTVTYPRLLSILLLIPTWWNLQKSLDVRRFGSHPTDIMLLGYLLLQLSLQFQNDTLTNTARTGLHALLDFVLPYYVASRSLRDFDACREAIAALVFAIALLVPVAAFESVKHWLLYFSLPGQMGADHWGMGGYLMRGDSLRAVASAGHSLVLGYMMVVGLALYPFLARAVSGRGRWMLGAALGLGVIAPMSRGPWIGAVAAIATLVLLSPVRWRRAAQLLGVTLPAAVLLAMTPLGDRIIDLMPFVGTVDSYNVEYRSRLLDAAWTLVKLHPLIGSSDFMNTPEMIDMIQGEGIVDLVNIYVSVALQSGGLGLALFCGGAVTAAWAAWARMTRSGFAPEQKSLGRGLLAALAGVVTTSATLSSILNVPIMYWLLIGILVGYSSVTRLATVPGAPTRNNAQTTVRNAAVIDRMVSDAPGTRLAKEWDR